MQNRLLTLPLKCATIFFAEWATPSRVVWPEVLQCKIGYFFSIPSSVSSSAAPRRKAGWRQSGLT
tara:strand:- start:10612 stop:10806 length:195 start_codon:yes stop_codon:yes gene_type:complete